MKISNYADTLLSENGSVTMPPSLYQYRRKVFKAVIASVALFVLTIIVGCLIYSLDKRSTFYVHNNAKTDIDDIVMQSGVEAVKGGNLKAKQSAMLRADLKSPSKLSIAFRVKQGKVFKSSMLYQKHSEVRDSVSVNIDDNGEIAWQVLGD